MIDLLVATLALASLVAIIVIIVRKFPKLSSINTAVIPAEQHGELKAKLIEDRFKRRMASMVKQVGVRMKPFGSSLHSFAKARYQQLLDMERRYRARTMTTAATTPEARFKNAERIDQVLSDAASAMSAGDYAKAEQSAIEVVGINPRSVAAYKLLAEIYLNQKDYEHARETLIFIIERLKVEDDELYAELGQAASGEGKFDEARRDLEQSIKIDSHVAQHHLDLSRVHLALGDSQAAFESVRQAVELEPNSPKFIDALVEAAIVAGKRDWASESLEKLRSVNSENQKLEEFAARIEALPKTKAKRV